MEYDDFLKQFLGQIGLYQIVFLIYASSCCITVALSFIDTIFIGFKPDFRCNILYSEQGLTVDNLKHLESNLTFNELIKLTSPKTDTGSYDTCQYCNFNYSSLSLLEAKEILDRNSSVICSNISICTSWIYSKDVLTQTIVSQWDLVCDRQWFVATQQAVMMSGCFTVLIGGWLADRYGRKFVTVGSVILQILARAAQGLSVNFYMFLVARFLLAAGALNLYTLAFTLCIEVVGPKWRVMAGQIPFVFTSISYISLACMAYFFRDWRTLTFANLLFAIPYISYICFLPESARWLVSKRKHKRATSILNTMAKVNRRTVPSHVYGQLKVTAPKEGTIRDLFQSRRMVMITIINTYLWFTTSMVYFGLSLFLPKLGGNIFISTIIAGALELPALLYVQLSLDTFLGRKFNSVLTFSSCGVSFIILMLIPKEYVSLILVFALFCKCAIKAAFSIIYIHTSEMYPTSLRTVSMSLCSSTARFGAILSPYVAYLDIISRYLPPTVMAVAALLAGGVSLLLSETRGKNLPDTIANLNDRSDVADIIMDVDFPEKELAINLLVKQKSES